MMADMDHLEKVEHLNQIQNQNQPLRIVQFKPASNFKLPDDWIVEERRRPSKPSHVDRYYYEPGTGKKFRSLIAVQKYLTEEKHYVTPERIMSENKDTSVMKSGSGKRSAPAVRSCVKSATKRSSVAEEVFTPKPLNFPVQSTPTETDSQRKFHLGKDHRGSTQNLSRPPEKVSWVLSGPGGFWSPFVDDSIVPESVKLKWSEAFVQSIHRGVIYGGLNS